MFETTMRVRLLHFFYLWLLVACGSATDTPSTEAQRLAARAQNVTIIRDDFGVPHIYAPTDADAVFGMLFAQAEDDFPRIERNYVWAIGRLAEIEGQEALYSDLRARLFMTVDEARAAYEASPAWLQELCDAFADGLNYYLQTHPDVTPRLLTRFEPWMPMFFSEGSIGGDIESVSTDGIAEFYGAPDAAAALRSASASKLEAPRGSNGFAIAGELTASGNAMLLINPHTSFFFRGEMHVVSEQGLNAYGAVTWGQFFIYQGFNEHTGWMHTSTDVDFMDEFAEQVFEANGSLAYRYGDEVRPVSVSDVTLRYRDGVALKERTFPLYRTHHGPVTHAVDGRWVATKLNWDPVNALIQSFTRTKLHNHDEFREMMNIRRNSSNNTVYADSSGNIAYYHGNFVPRRDVSFDYAHPVDGSNPATDWQGLHEVDELVTILNPPNGWIQNCNSTPFTAAGPFSPKRADYPYYMAPDHENFRGINAVRLLTGVSDVTLDSLIDIAYETYLPGFESLVPGLIQAFDEAPAPPERLRAPIDALRTWDLRVGVDSVAMTLAHFYGERFMDEGNLPASLADASFIDQLTFHATQTDVAERLAVFGRVLDRLEKDFGRWDVRWGEVNRYQRLTGDIDHVFRDDQPSLPIGMASNSWGALASFSASRYEDSRKIYGRSGNSFVAVVEFGDKLSAKTLLAGGQSGDPDSPHFDDQARRYADRVFKDVAFYRAEVDARATRTYHPGE